MKRWVPSVEASGPISRCKWRRRLVPPSLPVLRIDNASFPRRPDLSAGRTSRSRARSPRMCCPPQLWPRATQRSCSTLIETRQHRTQHQTITTSSRRHIHLIHQAHQNPPSHESSPSVQQEGSSGPNRRTPLARLHPILTTFNERLDLVVKRNQIQTL
jgi:hypothetical protein